MNKYVSPTVRARAIVAGEPSSVKTRHHSLRMVRLSPTVIADLKAEEAPVHVFRWVTWTGTLTEQRCRTDLAIHLRRSIDRPRNGWVDKRHCNAATAEETASGEPLVPELDDEIEEEPVSARQLLKGRDHVLRVLSDTARAAVAAHDMEAVDAATNAISWLCGGREAG